MYCVSVCVLLTRDLFAIAKFHVWSGITHHFVNFQYR